mgnify:CR=1 FL=1
MESQVNEVKSRTDIVGLVSNYVSLKKAGRNYKGVCPFHSEKTPSFMVSPERQIYKCFGCSEGGDALSFYEKIEGVDFGDALRALAIKAGVTLKEYNPSPATKQKEVFGEIIETTSKFYHFLLTRHPSGKKALEYLKERGVNENSIKDFQLGFAPDSWDTTLKYLLKKKFSERDIIASGVAIPSQTKGAYDRFRRRIIFPIFNTTGSVVGFSGRVFGEGEPKYLNSPENLLFNKSNVLFGLNLAKSEIKKEDTTVLVEGNLDVISSYQVGVKNVVCPLGTALTEKQLELLRRFSENLIISFDQDTAGIAAATRAIEMSENLGLNVKLAEISAKDPDELIKENPSLWKESLKKAVSGYEFVFNKTISAYPTLDQNSIRKITRDLVPILRKIDNEITRSHYERLLAAKLEVDVTSVRIEVQKGADNFRDSREEKKLPLTQNERESLEKYLLSLIFQLGTLPKEITNLDFEIEKNRAFFEIAVNTTKENKIDVKVISEKIPQEFVELFNEISLRDLQENLLDQEKTLDEIKTCATRLKELNLRTRLKEASLAIKQAELRHEDQKLEILTKQFKTLSDQLSIIEKARET